MRPILGFVLSFLAELISGGLLGVVGFIIVDGTYSGSDPILTVLRLLGYVFGVFIGVIMIGGLSGGDGNSFLALVGAAIGAIFLYFWGSNTLEQASTILDLLEASFFSVAVFGPALASSGYALGRLGSLLTKP